MIPDIAANRTQGIASLKLKSKRLFHLVFPFSIALMLTAWWWFPLVFGARFVDSVPLFNTFLLLTATHLLFVRTVLIAIQDTKIISVFAIIEIAINVIATICLAPHYGLLGMVLGTLIAYVSEKIMLIVYTW